jgi:hypothetical protein
VDEVRKVVLHVLGIIASADGVGLFFVEELKEILGVGTYTVIFVSQPVNDWVELSIVFFFAPDLVLGQSSWSRIPLFTVSCHEWHKILLVDESSSSITKVLMMMSFSS